MRRKILYVVTEDWYFWSHRLPIAQAALLAGYEVVIATRVNRHAQEIADAGFRLIPLQLSRSSYSPLQELRSVRELRAIYRLEQPEIVHHVALKPILYGSIAAMGQDRIQVVNAFAGLGYLVASSSFKARLLRPLIWNALRLVWKHSGCHLLLQNDEDKALIAAKLKLPAERISLIRGSGVNVNRFRPVPEPGGVPVVLMASRMLWIKGVQQFVEAARMLREKGMSARFVLAGSGDANSPSCVSNQQMLEWEAAGVVECWGHRADMDNVLKCANLICLPSHGGEGVPKVLIEAAASGRAIIATEVPGCRDIVRDGVNGLLVPPRNAAALAEAIEKLLNDPGLRCQMANRGRQIAVREFSEEVVVQATLEMYSRLLESTTPACVATG